MLGLIVRTKEDRLVSKVRKYGVNMRDKHSISEAELWAVFLDAGKAPGRRRGVLLHIFCFVLLCSRLLVVFSYWFCLLAVSYDSCPMIPLGASHTRSVRLLVPAKSTLGSQT
ncbi:hypothetical protein YC2023_099772 [Brassica napus]